jgi:mRNA interferase MazF
MPYRRGDVVLARFPYADLIRYKKRPCLVVQDENCPTGLTHCIVVQITSLGRTGPSRVPIAKTSLEGQQMGLVSDSVVVADQIQTVEDKVIEKSIGTIPTMRPVDSALKAALGL